VAVRGGIPVRDEVAVGRAVSVGDKLPISVRKIVGVPSMKGEDVSIGVVGRAVIVCKLVFSRFGGKLGEGEITDEGVAMAILIPAVEKRPDKPQQKRTIPAMDEIATQAGLFIAALLSGRMRPAWRPPRRISPAAFYPYGE
jgi:hypothetical protein